MPPRKNTTTSRKNYYYYGSAYGQSWKTSNRTSRRSNWPTATWTCNSPRYNSVRNECQWRIGSYRNVYTQFTGSGTTNWSPTTANRWMRYVNNGYQVYKFSHNEFCRYFGNQWAYNGPTAARRYLATRFGSYIKDVTRGKGNCWLVATTRTPTARPFNNYDWM